jgi:hypothetical protein
MRELPSIHAPAGETVIVPPGAYELLTGGGRALFVRGESTVQCARMDVGGEVEVRSHGETETIVTVNHWETNWHWTPGKLFPDECRNPFGYGGWNSYEST